MTQLVRNGLIFDAVHPEPYKADILIRDGKIKQIGTGLKAPRGTKVIDAEGLNVYPGLVECHGHIGLDGWAMG
ncbi:MAG: amidohydrolase, partial [Clostridia bacterium]|nr:amidohydrolase [Clostridia bacterium]